ncbi:hypothetical protein XM38_024560 [Halomicronema hongdechloris C2206]|uniref:Uncharacterized protein n=1 Tax=Halomicronema hongdechloris C2206 TaxID=1641165 RepID=A0A1Z3HMG3_9CYAN|nr:hypothetical protein [Halomicronema hongdechloris]ASC71504.1 hypothetical protein XM38_024560 [Halomicronema hongdechloris C2206]
MKTTPQGLTVLVRPCDSGMCPALYADAAGRMFVQGSKLNRTSHAGLTVLAHEEVVEITPELIAFLKAQ